MVMVVVFIMDPSSYSSWGLLWIPAAALPEVYYGSQQLLYLGFIMDPH
jgi:hypothetical protein